jgi:acyl-CoA dehydrogenase family member 9
MAGERSFMKALFHGVISEELFVPYPEPNPRERDTVNGILERVRQLSETHVDSARIDRDARIPDETLDAMRGMGLFGLNIPEVYGGTALSHTAVARIMEALAHMDLSVAITVGAHQSLGIRPLLLDGSERQKRRYLPRLATGELIAGFALTESRAGSDTAGLETLAELAPDGEGYVLNGSKRWVTNGAVAGLFTVFARASPSGGQDDPRITAFLVERDHGLRTGPEEPKLGLRGASTTALLLEDVKVPSRNIIGQHGRGVELAMRTFNEARPELAAACLGACKRLLSMAVDRCSTRYAFGRPIADFEMIQEKIARMMCETYALESMTYLTTGLIDGGVPDYSLESAMCKVRGATTLWHLADETLQIAGGEGYMADHPYERMLRDARVAPIYGGTNEVLKAFIALAGLQGPGEQRAEVSKALREPLKGLGVLSDFALQRARSALGRERLEHVHPRLKAQAALFEEVANALAQQVDQLLRKHGSEIANRQFVQSRLADVAIDLLALAAVLSRTTRLIEARGEDGARREIDLAAGFAAAAHQRTERASRDLQRKDDDLLPRLARHAYDAGGY